MHSIRLVLLQVVQNFPHEDTAIPPTSAPQARQHLSLFPSLTFKTLRHCLSQTVIFYCTQLALYGFNGCFLSLPIFPIQRRCAALPLLTCAFILRKHLPARLSFSMPEFVHIRTSSSAHDANTTATSTASFLLSPQKEANHICYSRVPSTIQDLYLYAHKKTLRQNGSDRYWKEGVRRRRRMTRYRDERRRIPAGEFVDQRVGAHRMVAISFEGICGISEAQEDSTFYSLAESMKTGF